MRIWREPDLSDPVHVHSDGVAVFPKLGPIQVTGIPIEVDLEYIDRW